jgi:6-phosphogluconolactonase (cycloisomerase 2 family)
MNVRQLFLVGSYTQPEAHVPAACGEGIVTCALDPATGRLERRGVFSGILNPSYLAWDAVNRRGFAASENISGTGAVYQFGLGGDGSLLQQACQPSPGAATCHVGVLPGGRVAAASYFGGCLAIYPTGDGLLAPASRVFHYEGRGPNPDRQEASHAHQTVVAPGERWFYVCDLGADCVWQHDIAAAEIPVGWPLPPGHGPRHLVFHPRLPRAYVLGELTGAVTVCDWNELSGALRVAATTPVLDEDAAAAAIRIHPSSRTLWISVRKTRSLHAFRLDEQGMPSAAAEIQLAAGEPRDFAISPDGRWLISANQSANELAVIELEPATGLPTGRPPGNVAVGTPVCVLFLPT